MASKKNDSTYSPHDIPIQAAATLVLIRDGENGLEVLLQQRSPDAIFVGGAWVFPGGKVDQEDSDPRWLAHSPKLNDQQASKLIELEQNGLCYWIAAIREAFEEAGVLLADAPPSLNTPSLRHKLNDNIEHADLNWLNLCEEHQLQLHTHKLHYLSRWITPPGPPRRYDTRFFLAAMPKGQHATHDDYEAIATRWLRPEDALKLRDEGNMELIFPTVITLKRLSEFNNCEAAIANMVDSK